MTESQPVTPNPNPPAKTPPFSPFWTWLGVILAVAGTLAFLLLTSPGLLAKANVIGAAVCHRIPSHSFFVHEHQLPLCQRCTGTFPGALTGLLVHWVIWRRRRSIKFPHWSIFAVLLAFAAVWGLDGFNSYTTLLTGRPEGLFGYAPQPWLRLLSGTLMGMGMSVLLVPAFNQTFWADGEMTATLRSWRELALLIAVELTMAALIYWLEPWLLYPVALYSVAGVVAMFVCLGSMVFMMALRKDNTLHGWRDAWVPLIWGLVFALAIIGTMNFLRFQAFGTLDGVPGLT